MLKRGESVVKKLWHDLAWDQFLDWQESGDRRAFKRVCKLIQDIDRNGAIVGTKKKLDIF